MRTFFALDLAPDVRNRIESARRALGPLPGKINWVSPENLHVTMNFVGTVDDSRIPELCAIAEQTAAAMPCTDIRFTNGPLVCIPPRGYLRMIWSAVTDPSGRMAALYEALRDPIRLFGGKADNRPFRGHVTVARIKTTRRADRIRKTVENLAAKDFGAVRAEHLVLYTSELKKTGPVYAPLVKAKLGG